MKSNVFKNILRIVIAVFAIFGFFSLLYFWGQFSNSEVPEGIPSSDKSLDNEKTEVDTIKFDLYYDFPSKIYNSNYQLFPVVFDVDKEIYKRAHYSANTITNVVIYDSKTRKGKIVFDSPVEIKVIDYPNKKEDSLQNYIVYNCIPFDSNKDGVINDKDKNVLFTSKLNGSNLIQITPATLNVLDYKELDKYTTLLIKVSNSKLKRFERNDKSPPIRNKLLWYNIKTHKMNEVSELSKLLDMAKEKFNE